MKSIEIKTTQNVVLQYDLAELRDRIIAWVIDTAAVFVVMYFLTIIMVSAGLTETSMVVAGFMISMLFVFYSLAFETLNNGQSIGKMAMRIRVIKTTGGKA